MSVRQLMRPAARSAAVRPHSSSTTRPRRSIAAPRPVSAASSCSASLFFVSPPRPFESQSYWLASPCSHLGWEQSAAWERHWEQEYHAFSGAYATVPSVPTHTRLRVMRTRLCVCSPLSLFLGTWEHSWILEQYQRLALFPRLFPALRRVGTWEHREAAGLRPDRSGAVANKLEAGNADLQRAAAGARQKFRAPIALELGRDLVDQARRPADLGNGGKPRFPARLAGHVGRAMLEGLRQAADLASFPGARLKLGRLRGLAQGELTLLQLARAPGAPNRGRRSPAMLALHAGRIWIEAAIEAAQGRFLLGHYSDRHLSDRENAQTITWRRGPGGIRLSSAAVTAGRRHNRRVWNRAGVNCSPAVARPHDAGETTKLRRALAAVNGLSA